VQPDQKEKAPAGILSGGRSTPKRKRPIRTPRRGCVSSKACWSACESRAPIPPESPPPV